VFFGALRDPATAAPASLKRPCLGVDSRGVKKLSEVLKLDQSVERGRGESVGMWLFLTASLFAAIYILRLFDQDARNGIAFLYSLPVALVALRFGLVGGLIGAGFAMFLVFVDSNAELVLSPIGHGTRAAILFAVGASIGWFVDREHRWQLLRLQRVETERRASAARMLSTQERERVRLARELHDEIGQSVTGLMLEIDRVAKQAPPEIGTQLRETQEAAREISDELRTIVRRLRPEALDALGLNRALIALTERIGEQSSLRIERRLSRDLPELSSDAELVVYRVAQEALTNIIRHAEASRAEVELSAIEEGVRLRVVDDGAGPRHDARAGSGIQGMRERAVLVGGRLTVGSPGVRGTEVVLEVPTGFAEPQPEPAEPSWARRWRELPRLA
jgi:signal transduction histidine kinase